MSAKTKAEKKHQVAIAASARLAISLLGPKHSELRGQDVFFQHDPKKVSNARKSITVVMVKFLGISSFEESHTIGRTMFLVHLPFLMAKNHITLITALTRLASTDEKGREFPDIINMQLIPSKREEIAQKARCLNPS